MQSWRQIIIIRHSKQSDTLQRAPQVFHFHTCSWREITRNVWNDRHQRCTWQKAFEPTIMCSFDNELFKSLYKPFWKSRWRLVDFLFSTTLLLSDCWWLQFSLSIFQSSPEVWDHHSCRTRVRVTDAGVEFQVFKRFESRFSIMSCVYKNGHDVEQKHLHPSWWPAAISVDPVCLMVVPVARRKYWTLLQKGTD